MTDDHNSPIGPETDPDAGRSPFGARRFARLVQSPTHRRLSLKRMLVAVLLTILCGWATHQASIYLQHSLGQYVAAQPEHQIPFAEIDLQPPPPPYIRSGAAGILASVRAEAKYGEMIPILDTDLAALRVALSRNPWIEAAGSVRSSYRHLAIEVVYRKPLAQVIFDNSKKAQAAVIDRFGVELPSHPSEFTWSNKEPHWRPAGGSAPLIEIRDLGKGRPDRVGLRWKSTDPTIDDDRVVEAAHLAEFLAEHFAAKTPQGRPIADFFEIYFHNREVNIVGFYVRDTNSNFVFWGSAPGYETRNEPAATEKWAMLAQYIDTRGALDLIEDQEFLFFHDGKAKSKRFKITGAAQNSNRLYPSQK